MTKQSENIQIHSEIYSHKVSHVQCKTPQELFASFQALPQGTDISKQEMMSPVTVEVPHHLEPTSSNKDEPLAIVTVDSKLKVRGMQPSIISPSSALVMKTAAAAAISSHSQPPVQNATLSSKPLLVQGHTNANPCYYMDQNGSYVGYAPQFPSYPYGIYGMSPPYLDPRYLYSQKPSIYQKKEPVSLPSAKVPEVKTIEQVQQSSKLRQSFAAIQGQMAANQIPLCLVQDSQGQLHQLVYTVPENLYEQYVVAAKKGFKVRVQPQLDSLKIALSNSGSNKIPKYTDLDDENITKSISADDLKLVKDIVPSVKHTSSREDNNCNNNSSHNSNSNSNINITTTINNTNTNTTTTNNIINNNNNNNNNNKTKEVTNDCATNETTKMTKDTSQMEILDEKPNTSPNVAIADPMTRSPNPEPPTTKSLFENRAETYKQIIAQDTKNSFLPSNVNVQENTKPVVINSNPYEKTKASITKEFLENIAQTRHSHQNSIKHAYKLLPSSNSRDCTKSTVIPTKPIQTSASMLDYRTSKLQNPPQLTRQTRDVDNDTRARTTHTQDISNESATNNERETPLTNHITTSKDDQLPSPTPLPIISKDVSRDITTIDDILSRNSNALIPKSDVESLLKCLKRKLELSEQPMDDESAGKRNKMTRYTRNKQPRLLRQKNNSSTVVTNTPYYLKSNSFDYESIDMLSPDTISDEGSPCGSVFSINDSESISTADEFMSNDSIEFPLSNTSNSSHNYPLANSNESMTEIFNENNLNDIPSLDGNGIDDCIFGKADINQNGSLAAAPAVGVGTSLTNLVGSTVNHDIASRMNFDIFDNLKYDFFDNESFLCPEILPASTVCDNRTAIESSKEVKGKQPEHTNKYTDVFSFPTGQQGTDMDLFDHLWNELETH